MKIVLVAKDYSPSRVFELIQKKYGLKNEVVSFLDENPIKEKDIINSDIVIIGISSSRENSEKEIAATKIAMEHKKIFGFFADSEGSRDREWIKNLKKYATFFLLESFSNIKKFEESNPGLNTVVVGNPLWENKVGKESIKVIRAKLGLKKNHVLLLALGGKSFVVNTISWSLLVESIQILKNKNVKLFILAHPRDGGFVGEKNLYRDLVEFSPVQVSFIDRDIFQNEINVDTLISAADVMIENGASTTFLNAVYLRKPIITLIGGVIGSKRLEKTGRNTSNTTCSLVHGSLNTVDLSKKIKKLIDKPTLLKKEQVRLYPKRPSSFFKNMSLFFRKYGTLL